MAVSSFADFALTYEGPALDDGRMPVRDLAPALLALGDLFHEANTVVNPGEPSVQLEIRAFRAGSFEVLLNLIAQAHAAIQDSADFMASPGPTGLANLITAVVGGSGLFSLAKRLYKRKVRGQQEEAAGGITRLILDDGTVVETPSATLLLYQRDTVRTQAREVVAPLIREGISGLRLVVGQRETVVIESGDVEAFDVPALGETPLGETESILALTITAISFAAGNKWRLSDGDHTFFASIEDEGFLRRVDRGEEVFGKGDILRCRLRIRQWHTDTGIRTEYSVLKVMDHIPSARTLPLPFTDD